MDKDIITIGNLVTILSFIIGLVVHYVVSSNRFYKFVGSTETKITTIEKDINTIELACKNCYVKKKIEDLEEDKKGIKEEQLKLRAELPSDKYQKGHINLFL